MIRWTLIVVGALVCLVLIVALIGWMLPAGHHAERRIVLKATPERVFGAITDVAQAATWRSDLQRVEKISGQGVGMTFTEVGSNGAVPFRVEVFEPARASGHESIRGRCRTAARGPSILSRSTAAPRSRSRKTGKSTTQSSGSCRGS